VFATAATLGTPTVGCTWLPAEFNLSPVYRHRLDERGAVLELDVLWPIVHYERTPDGGDDFRIRPLYRRVTEPVTDIVGQAAVEHQFLWPLGRVRADEIENRNRFFPLWWYTSRLDYDGQRDIDWYALFPFFWGGHRADDNENYLGVFPFWVDFRDFLVYDRLKFVLWPLYTRTEKDGRVGNLVLWPFIGWGSGPDGYRWDRFLPLWSFATGPRYHRWSVLWPFFSWGTEGLDTERPAHHFMFWPFYGRKWGRGIRGWTALWPFFQDLEIEGRTRKVDIFWPFLRFEEDRSGATPLLRWWFWPLVSRTLTDVQSSWVFLWPLFWWGRYSDPDAERERFRFVPFYTHSRVKGIDGKERDDLMVWPWAYRSWTARHGEHSEGQWWYPAPWPWTRGNAYGVREHYAWMWTVAEGQRRGPDDVSMHLTANLFTTRDRGARRSMSVPFLFSYDADEEDGTVWLFQFLPIPVGGRSTEETRR
jgi:hypothetical protein